VEAMSGVLQAASSKKLDRILDAGCGDGGAFELLGTHFDPKEIIAVDIDPKSIEYARAAAAHSRLAVDVRLGDVTQLALADGSVDMIFCHQTLHHVTDQRGALREFRRVLRQGGVLLICESCRHFIYQFRVRAFFRHPMEVQRSAEEYVSLLRESGFDIAPDQIATSLPWWSSDVVGLRNWVLGEPRQADGVPTQVHVAAVNPLDDLS
jgi:ubiquinone/menaquinone biosynthesis C-methylase UbiE